MYLSSLLIDTGDNPDRPRPGRLWLRNLYRVHQRLCMAFPTASKVSDDAEFLKPFSPSDFDQVHVARGAQAGFLFRVDPQPGTRVVILIQSAMKPDWDYAFHNADYLLAAPPQVTPFETRFAKDQPLRFRLAANPTRKIDTKSGPDGHRKNGRRVPVPEEKLFEWLACRAERAGFSIDQGSITIQTSYIYFNKPADRKDKSEEPQAKQGQRLLSTRFEGVLRVADTSLFGQTLAKGIGPGKAFGFGLLSVAPLRG